MLKSGICKKSFHIFDSCNRILPGDDTYPSLEFHVKQTPWSVSIFLKSPSLQGMPFQEQLKCIDDSVFTR